ncbi:hypothetical protein BDP27DRAFT_1336461 [Rhodocollybia butyracea]|uniref:Uncharacterized protein n=1 Tax=Rhodocollybia butyracea TaxID=206335 RepID=A0A9P5PFX0_9AGAR|nr:hypothetical protein BDP27DRAFT_1336461 [Rhodocollybia butyracea]
MEVDKEPDRSGQQEPMHMGDHKEDPLLSGMSGNELMTLICARKIETHDKKKFRYALPTRLITNIPYISANNPRFHHLNSSLYIGSPICPTYSVLEANPSITPDPSPLCFPKAPKYILTEDLRYCQGLRGYSEYPRISEVFHELFDITWGTSSTEPIFHLDGIKLNQWSQAEKPDCYDGSASLGITVEEQSSGFVQPAVQAVTDEAQVILGKLLVLLAELYKLIVPLCISKQEWEAWLFRLMDVNALCCGALHSGFSGVQRNLSSSFNGGSLALVLGILTGAFHVDWNDDPNGYTLLIALFWLPPGMPKYFIQIFWY